MTVKLICASHSPLMEFASPAEKQQEQTVRHTFEKLAAEVKAYDPTLIIPRFYVSTSKSIIKALINMHSFEIQLS
ncbi:hypothetical protein ACVR1R_18140, partial [Acinetobacter baumannii]